MLTPTVSFGDSNMSERTSSRRTWRPPWFTWGTAGPAAGASFKRKSMITGAEEQNNLKTKDKTKAFHGIKTYLKIVDSLAKFRRRTVSGDMSDISVWNNSSTSSFLASSDTKVALLKRRVVQLDENKYKLLFLGCGSRKDRGTGNSQRGDESLCLTGIRTGRFVSWFDNKPRLVAILVSSNTGNGK